jgi:fructoselysine 6-kinase
MPKKRLLALGTCCVDVYPDKNELRPGGEALNIASQLSGRADATVFLRSHLGEDDYAAFLLDAIKRLDIEQRITTEPGESAHHVIKNAADGDRYFEEGAWHGGVGGNLALRPEDLDLIANVDAIFATLWEPNLRAIAERDARSGLLAVDFNEQRDLSAWEDVLTSIDIACFSADQRQVPELRERARRSDTLYLLTFGGEGSLVFHQNDAFECPAIQQDRVIDTTGCGDCYQAHFVAELLQGSDIPQAMRIATARASEVTQYLGGVRNHP